MVYCLVTSPLLLVVMALAGGAAYFISNRNKESKLMIAGKENLHSQSVP